MKRHTQQGMALVITLIMLAVITVVAVAFLAVTRRDRSSTAQAFAMSDSQLAADAARERALAEIAAILMNPTNAGLIVSTNWDVDTIFWGGQIDPRPPVFVRTNWDPNPPPTITNSIDFRYFIDLNRNGIFDPTDYLDPFGNRVSPTDTNGSFYIGDPQWIGILEKIGFPHTNYNRYIGRYAYMVVPAGRTLDINYIHNQVMPDAGFGRRFYRNQGFGTYEINLAALLADLNTNLWGMGPNVWDPYFIPYTLDFSPWPISKGNAFNDAYDLLRFRYLGGEYPASMLVANVFSNHVPAFIYDGIDGCAFLPPNLTDLPDRPWPGGNSLRHYFSMHDFLNAVTKTNYGSFYTSLMNASRDPAPYHRYTFYRMLEQLGTDSAPERADLGPEHEQKINLNYSNALANFTATNPLHSTIQPGAETNFVDWDPTQFFMTVSERLLRRELGRFTWNEGIPIYSNGSPYLVITDANGTRIKEEYLYSGRIHQLLKITANLYDATHTNYFPTVFRPQFATREIQGLGTTNIYIIGYTNEQGVAFFQNPWHTLDSLGQIPSIGLNDNIYDIPVIVGAKKGHPAFNKVAADTIVSVTRKLRLDKDLPTDTSPKQDGGTNQMFIIGVTNTFGIQAWNSYSQSYPPPGHTVDIWVSNTISSSLVYDNKPVGTNVGAANRITIPDPRSGATWAGYQKNLQSEQPSFRVAMFTNLTLIPDSVLHPGAVAPNPTFEPVGPQNSFDKDIDKFQGQMTVYVSNRFNFYIVDTTGSTNYLIDAVSFSDLNTIMDLGFDLSNAVQSASSRYIRGIWDFTPMDKINRGVNNQLIVGTTPSAADETEWAEYAQGGISNRLYAIDRLRVFVGLRPETYSRDDFPPTNAMQCPFSPWQRVKHRMVWEVNDPLVHFVTNDLVLQTNATINIKANEYVGPYTGFTNFQLFVKNKAYKPWGYDESSLAREPMIRDPQVMGSDDWNFPTNKLPNIGWIGRVHRATPWQTIYLKDKAADAGIWLYPQGPGYNQENHPTKDWWLVDIFTVAQHPNATRGQLSINQRGLAAWSAVLSGVGVTAAGEGTDVDKTVIPIDTHIEPAAKNPALLTIWEGINRKRALMPQGLFTRFSELLSVPELTTGSPYLGYTNITVEELKQFTLRDEDYERIPQQILSLLRLGDERYVIYAWGQSLKPAPNSVVTSGASFGVCTNYQITGEVATRTVVRFERPMVPNPMVPKQIDGTPDYNYYEPMVRDTNNFRAVVESYNLMPPE